jgi:thioredoxin reductase
MAVAYHLKEQGVEVTVYERFARSGGTWIYEEEAGPSPPIPCTHPNSFNPTASITAMYAGLHTNLPAPSMGYRALPFDSASSMFPPHKEVLQYLDRYYNMTNIHDLVKFNSVVSDLRPTIDSTSNDGWTVTLESGESRQFDAVAVCNGHYGMPYIPNIPGLREFAESNEERVMHSKNFRRPERYKDKNVLIIGGGYSGIDIGREIAAHATSVTQSIHTQYLPLTTGQRSGVKFRGDIKEITENAIVYNDGEGDTPHPDHIVVCTGYLYSYPFLNIDPAVVTDGKRVHNLAYQCLYAPRPSLAFIGIPWKIVPFPLFEVQAKFVAYCWRGYKRPNGEQDHRPNAEELKEEVAILKNGGRDVHCLASQQWPYQNLLALWYHGEKTEQWRIDLRDKTEELRAQYQQSAIYTSAKT